MTTRHPVDTGSDAGAGIGSGLRRIIGGGSAGGWAVVLAVSFGAVLLGTLWVVARATAPLFGHPGYLGVLLTLVGLVTTFVLTVALLRTKR